MRYVGRTMNSSGLVPICPGFRMLAEPRQGYYTWKNASHSSNCSRCAAVVNRCNPQVDHDAVSLQIKNGPLVHGTKINLNDEKVHLELLNGQAAETQMDRVEWVCPAYMKSADAPTRNRLSESTNGNNSGLLYSIAHTPFAMVVDDRLIAPSSFNYSAGAKETPNISSPSPPIKAAACSNLKSKLSRFFQKNPCVGHPIYIFVLPQ